jgi:hypothetical protein
VSLLSIFFFFFFFFFQKTVATNDVSVCTSILRLENKDATQLVAFKVKTTAVKRYVVRPNIGILLPGKSVEVAVLVNYDRARQEKVDLSTVHDRFQVLSVVVDVGATDQLLELWSKTPEEAICKTMVKCKFVAPNLVKTIAPVANANSPSTPHGQALGSPEPDLEQAKSIFKQEMANTKAKQEAKTLRAERDAAQAALKERDGELQKLREEVTALRKGGGGGVVGAERNNRGLLGKGLSALFYILVYLVLMAVFFVVCYKVFGYDPIGTLWKEYSLKMLERRLKLKVDGFLKN